MEEGVGSASEASYGINVAKTEIREGHNLGDAERVLAAYSDRFSDMTAGQPSFGGSEANVMLRARLEHLFARYQVKFMPLTMEIKVFGGFAIAYGWHEIALAPKSGEPARINRKRYGIVAQGAGWPVAHCDPDRQ